MPDRRGRVPAAVAALAAVPLLGGGHATLAGWGDAESVGGASLTTAAVTAPQVSCGSVGARGIDVSWLPVPDATGYRVYLPGQPQPLELSAGSTDTRVAVPGTVTVTATFGSWESSGSSLTLTLLPTPSCS
jgi:hypothetical protein